MNIRSAYSFRTINVTGAIIAAAMIAAACGSDEEPAVAPVVPAATTTTITEASVTVPVQDESPSTTTTAGAETSEPELEPEPVQDAAPNLDVEPVTAPTDEPEPTTTTVPSTAEQVDESTASTTVPQVTEPEDGAEPEPDAEPDDSTKTIPPDASVDPPADGTETEPAVIDTGPEPEPGPAPTTTLPEPEPEPEPTDNEAKPDPEAEPEPAPDPDPEPVDDILPEPEVIPSEGVVCNPDADGVYDCDIPENAACVPTDDGGLLCYPPGWEPDPGPVESAAVWVPPVAGMVPEVHPDTPLSEWQRGDGSVDPGQPAYDKPRNTAQVQDWVNSCIPADAIISCAELLHHMKQALDYLGANPECVLNMYAERVNYHLKKRSGADRSYARDTFGWHMCATVIDPIVVEIPDGPRANDEKLRLSDTPGITLAERCRKVLTDPFPDIQLETPWRGDTPPTRFGNDCDAWAASRTTTNLWKASPVCAASVYLADEWMEHHHGQHERYFGPWC